MKYLKYGFSFTALCTLCVLWVGCSKPGSGSAERADKPDTVKSETKDSVPKAPPLDAQKQPDVSLEIGKTDWTEFDAFFVQFEKTFNQATTGEYKVTDKDFAELVSLAQTLEKSGASHKNVQPVLRDLVRMVSEMNKRRKDPLPPSQPGQPPPPPQDMLALEPVFGSINPLMGEFKGEMQAKYTRKISAMMDYLHQVMAEVQQKGQNQNPPPEPGKGGGQPPPPPPPPPGGGH